jgi:hypothetical protein
VSSSQPCSAPSQRQPATPAKRSAAQLEGREQQGGGCIGVATPCAGLSAAALQCTTPSSSK